MNSAVVKKNMNQNSSSYKRGFWFILKTTLILKQLIKFNLGWNPLLISKIGHVKKECFKQRPREVLGDNIATLRSKKLPVVQTEYRGFWEREWGMGSNKKMYAKDSLMFFITDIDGFIHQVLQTFVFGQNCMYICALSSTL